MSLGRLWVHPFSANLYVSHKLVVSIIGSVHGIHSEVVVSELNMQNKIIIHINLTNCKWTFKNKQYTLYKNYKTSSTTLIFWEHQFYPFIPGNVVKKSSLKLVETFLGHNLAQRWWWKCFSCLKDIMHDMLSFLLWVDLWSHCLFKVLRQLTHLYTIVFLHGSFSECERSNHGESHGESESHSTK